MGLVDGRVVIVTGAGGGIGRMCPPIGVISLDVGVRASQIGVRGQAKQRHQQVDQRRSTGMNGSQRQRHRPWPAGRRPILFGMRFD